MEAFIVVLQRLPVKITGHRVYGCMECFVQAPKHVGVMRLVMLAPQKNILVSLLLIGLTLAIPSKLPLRYSTSCLTPPRLSSSSVHPFSRNVVSLERTQVLSRPSLLLGTAQIFCPVIIVISSGLSADALSRLLSV